MRTAGCLGLQGLGAGGSLRWPASPARVSAQQVKSGGHFRCSALYFVSWLPAAPRTSGVSNRCAGVSEEGERASQGQSPDLTGSKSAARARDETTKGRIPCQQTTGKHSGLLGATS